jgi:signal transduction histidine kinase/DNA-binding response OmpR family regulator
MNAVLISFLLLISAFALGQEPDPQGRAESANHSSTIDSLITIAHRYRFVNLDTALQAGEHSLELALKSGDKERACDASVAIGLAHLFRLFQDRALKYGLDALRLSDSIDYDPGRLESMLLLGSVYMDIDKLKAERLATQALELALKLQKPRSIARAYNLMGTYHRYQLNDDAAALKYYQLGLKQLGKPEEYPVDRAFLLNNIATFYIKTEPDPLHARALLNQALKISRKHGIVMGVFRSTIRLAQLDAAAGQYEIALRKLLLAERLAARVGTPSAMLEIANEMREVNSKLGRSDEAVLYGQRYDALKDSLFDLTKGRKIALMEMTHEMELKEQSIKLLEYEKEIQVFWRNVLIGGFVLVCIAATIIYMLIRSRARKTRQLLEVEKLLTRKLQEVDRLKSAFFANISHEFRTPLTLILAPLEEELKKKNTPESREGLILIRRNANRLLDLVNQLLDLAKLEAGKMELEIRKGDLKQLVDLLLHSFDALARKREIIFEKNVRLPEHLYWFDQDKIEKIISNILLNAFKFTPANGVVSVSMSIKKAGRHLHVSIKDSGPGIATVDQEKIFSPFYQVKNSNVINEGTGLGLPLVKELVKLYGGTIEVSSEPGNGAIFNISVPIRKEEFPERSLREGLDENNIVQDYERDVSHQFTEESVQHDADKDLILIVEDNLELRHYITSALSPLYNVITAADGAEAFPLAFQHVPVLILTDLMMPNTSGIELTRIIKNDERTSHIPVILLTAKSDSRDRLEGLKTGADDYVTKPFSPEELLVRINNLIRQRKKLEQRYLGQLQPGTRPTALSIDDKFLLKVGGIIESNLADDAFTVEALAHEAGLSKMQLLRKLKALTGLSPNDYIKNYRLKRAAEMISANTDTISQIGYAVGFSDQSYFAKCFKKQFGVSPSAYKQSVSVGGTVVEK